jgi:hypothetical protein
VGKVRIVLGAAAVAGALALAAPAQAQLVDDACAGLSPSGVPCVFGQKFAERVSAECRRLGRPAKDCRIPLGHQVGDDISAAYRGSWLHRAAAFQYALGDRLPLRQAQWLGTHNSFNTVAEPATLSHSDSNQQLTLDQQLDIDVRSLELDLHWLPSVHANGAKAVVVCHGRGPDEQHLGCTNERLFSKVLPQIASWLNGHRGEVVLLYLEDELGDAAGYTETVKVLDTVLRRPDGGSLIYHPSNSEMTATGCADLPLALSRDRVRTSGAQVVLVGNCRSGWAADVYGWDDVHVESGSTPKYREFPTCDATYARTVYDTKLVRYYEDSTFVSSAIDPTRSPKAAAAEMISPEKAAAMTRCGVNLFGFDQLLPNDGRIEASIWSWAKDKPDLRNGRCAVQRPDGRWTTRGCGAKHRAACRLATGGWQLTQRSLAYDPAVRACRELGGILGVPRTGYDNSRLRTLAGQSDEVWLGYRLTG